MTNVLRLVRCSAVALAVAVPCRLQAQHDSLADFGNASAMIDSTLRAHFFDPRLLGSEAAGRLSKSVDSLARSSASRREFISGFNRLCGTGPVSHVRVSRAQAPARIMMDVMDTMRVGDNAVTLRWAGSIAILEVRTMMGIDTREQISVLYKELITRGARGLVIDLRENQGGAFAVVPLVGHLIGSSFDGGVFTGQRWSRKHDRAPTLAEVVALSSWTGWSLKRFWEDVEGVGTLRIRFEPMEPRFAGLMLSQRIFDLVPGVHLTLPIADYDSASMGRIEGVGVTPSVSVPAVAALDSALARLDASRTSGGSRDQR